MHSRIAFYVLGLPPTDDTTEVSRTVCVQMFVSDCQMSWNIAIKKCPGNFLVYNLVESETSNSAYCFGKWLIKRKQYGLRV